MRKLTAFLTILIISGCATVYTSAEFTDYQSKHRVVAILPYTVTIDLKELPDGMSHMDLTEQERDEGYMFQGQLYSQFMKQYGKDRYTVAFQDIDKTNAILAQATIEYERLSRYTKEDLATLLGVDAIISGSIKRSKPMGNGAALASLLFLGYSRTNEVNVNMRIHDGINSRLIWSYDHRVAGGLGSSPEGVAKSLMKKISKKFPYEK